MPLKGTAVEGREKESLRLVAIAGSEPSTSRGASFDAVCGVKSPCPCTELRFPVVLSGGAARLAAKVWFEGCDCAPCVVSEMGM